MAERKSCWPRNTVPLLCFLGVVAYSAWFLSAHSELLTPAQDSFGDDTRLLATGSPPAAAEVSSREEAEASADPLEPRLPADADTWFPVFALRQLLNHRKV